MYSEPLKSLEQVPGYRSVLNLIRFFSLEVQKCSPETSPTVTRGKTGPRQERSDEDPAGTMVRSGGCLLGEKVGRGRVHEDNVEPH